MKKLTLLVWLLLVATAFADGTSGGGGGGGGGGAPVDSTYFVKSADAAISAENVVQTNGTGVSVTYNTVPDPDTVTFALDTAANITWGGTWATTGTFSTTNSLTLGAAGYLIGLGTTEAQATCAAGSGCIFYEQSSDKWRVSQSGGSYADLVTTASGTDLTAVPFVTTATSALLSAENVLTQGVGIDITTTGGTTTLGIDTVTVACSGDFGLVANAFDFCQSGIAFEGTAANTVEGYLVYDNPSVDQTIHIPDLPGADTSAILITDSDSGTVTGTMILDATVEGDDIGIGTTTGDMMYLNSSGTWVRLPIGSVDDVLTVEGGLPGWSPNACVGGGIEVSTATFVTAEASDDLSFEQVLTDGDGIAFTTATASDPDTITANVLADESTISVATGEVAIIESGVEAILDLNNLQGAVTDAQVPNTITINTAATATALAADGTDCSSGEYARGVDASGNAELCTTAGSGSANPLSIVMEDEFQDNSTITAADSRGGLNWGLGQSGTASGATAGTATSDHPYVLELTTGSTAAGQVGILLGGATSLAFGGGEVFTFIVKIPTLSDGSETFTCRLGACDQAIATGDCTDGLYFDYNTASSTNWIAATAEGTARSKDDGNDATAGFTDGTPVAVGTDWTVLQVELNAGATTVTWKAGATTSALTTIGSYTGANIPDSGDTFRMYAACLKSVGGTARTMQLDYFKLTKTVVR